MFRWINFQITVHPAFCIAGPGKSVVCVNSSSQYLMPLSVKIVSGGADWDLGIVCSFEKKANHSFEKGHNKLGENFTGKTPAKWNSKLNLCKYIVLFLLSY